MFALKNQFVFVDRECVDDYPVYSFGERVADGTIHVIGIVASVTGAIWLAQAGYLGAATPMQLAMTIYIATVVALFVLSASYHMTPWPRQRPLLRRFDQSAIFFKIAGSYTPLVVAVGSGFSYSVLAFIWACALVGSGFKLFTGDRLDKYTVSIFLGMGWCSVLLIWPLYNTLSLVGATLIVIGGLIYTAGVNFHQAGHIKYNNAIWHGFVFVASCFHFAAIVYAATPSM